VIVADRYEVLDTMVGGQGRLVQARDIRHGRLVALKMRPAGDVDRDAFLAEARTLLALTPHRHLPVAREDFFWGDDYVLAMDWVEGEDLAGTGPLPPARVLVIASQVADALDHLHNSVPPVVHGDVKPANVRVTPSGEAVLVDLGLVGAGPGSGTAGYCAPEVAAGGQATPAADVYGLAATAGDAIYPEPDNWPWFTACRDPAHALRDSLVSAEERSSAAEWAARMTRDDGLRFVLRAP
jgi:serine/threonine protein kinase